MPFLLRGDRTKNNRTLPKRALMGRDKWERSKKKRLLEIFEREKSNSIKKKLEINFQKKYENISFSKFLKDNVLDLIPFITFNSHLKQITGQKTFHLCKHVLVFLYLIDSRFSSYGKNGTF